MASCRWVITDFVCDEDFWYKLLDEGKIEYFGYGEETCPTTGKKHWQGFAVTDRKSFRSMIKMLQPRHVEKMRGTIQANERYCSKQSQMVHIGARPTNVNSTDNGAAMRILDNGGDYGDCVRAGFNRSVLYFAKEYEQHRVKRTRAEFERPSVFWFWGKTGTGKSRTAREMCTGPYWVAGTDLRWFDDYKGEEFVIIDDFRPAHAPFETLLRLTDVYTVRVQKKGSHVVWMPKVIIITTPLNPDDTFRNTTDEDLDQLHRRITEVREFTLDETDDEDK